MNGFGMNEFGMGFGWLIPILVIVGLFYFLNDNKENIEKSPKEILDIRLAKGEIDKEEYEEYLKVLNA